MLHMSEQSWKNSWGVLPNYVLLRHTMTVEALQTKQHKTHKKVIQTHWYQVYFILQFSCWLLSTCHPQKGQSVGGEEEGQFFKFRFYLSWYKLWFHIFYGKLYGARVEQTLAFLMRVYSLTHEKKSVIVSRHTLQLQSCGFFNHIKMADIIP